MIQSQVKVLLIEDDEDDVVLTRALLREIETAHFETVWAPSFDEGLNKLCAGDFDVCLVDYRLGSHDGIELIGQAASHGCHVPIILLTGQGDHAIDMAAMNAGAADFLNKGQITSAMLERSIRYSIQHHKSQEQRIRLLTEQAARAQAEAENRAKDQFLAVLSHELRTPLSAVMMSVSALEQEGDIPERSCELLSIIKRNVNLEARLIDDLLDITRISRGKLELRKELVDLHEQIHDTVVTCCGSEIQTKGVEISLSLNAARHHVLGDPARLQQVLWNLVKNAVKFTPEGGAVSITTFDGDAGNTVIEVKDTGIGIDAEALPKIFHAFEQADRDITRKFGGLGLGLAICRALVEMHGGSISAHSGGPNQGATFRVELPPAPAATPKHHGLRPSGPLRASNGERGVSILLVEDHPDTARAMKTLLNLRGYDVRSAGSIAEALAAADDSTFDVLVSDIGLPDGSGLELMRQLLTRRPVKGIALSGFGMEEDVNRSREAGFAEHLTKPIDLKQLEAAIARVTA